MSRDYQRFHLHNDEHMNEIMRIQADEIDLAFHENNPTMERNQECEEVSSIRVNGVGMLSIY
jgi:hypothetical protein